MKRLASILIVLVVGTMTLPSLAQTAQQVAIGVKQVEIDVIILPEALDGIVSKAANGEIPGNPVDATAYTEYASGPVSPGPEVELSDVSYLYIPFDDAVKVSELRVIFENSGAIDKLTLLPRDLPEEALPSELSVETTGVWVVLGQLSQQLTPGLCENHSWKFNVTVANPGRTPFEANENRPGSYFDGGDVLYGAQIDCGGLNTFVNATTDTGGATAWPGWAPFFYNGDTVVGAVIPDTLFAPDAAARTTLEENPPRGEQPNADDSRFQTDSPVGEPLLEVAEFDQWPECAVELGFTPEAEGQAEEPAEAEGSADEEATATTQGVTPAGEETPASTDNAGSGLPWFFWVGIAGMVAVLGVYFALRDRDERATLRRPTPPADDNPHALAWLSPTEPFEPSGGIPNQTPTNDAVEQVGGDILQNDLADEQDIDSHFAQQAAAPDEQDLLEAKYLLGIFGFGDFTSRSDAVLAADIDTAVEEIRLPIPPDNLCEKLREQCNKAIAELDRRRQILNQKEAALAQAEADQSKLDKELDALNEFLKGGGDSIESEGDREEEIDLRLKERYLDQRRSAYEADLAAAGDDRDARSAASRRFEEETKDAGSREARKQRREQAAQARDEVAEDAADADKRTRAARDERNLAHHSVEKGGEHVAKVCAEADKCDGEVEDAATFEEEIKRKLREQQARDDAEWEERKKAGFPDHEEDARPVPVPPVPPPPKPGSPGPTPEKTDVPEIPPYIESLGCTTGDEILNFVSSTSDVMYTDPNEDLKIKFFDVDTPQLEDWLKKANPEQFDDGAVREELTGVLPTQSVLDVSGDGAASLLRGDPGQGSDSYRGVANLIIRVELTVRTATFACAEVWKCNQAGKYEFGGYRCQRVIGSEGPSQTPSRDFSIHGLNVRRLFLDMQAWIRSYVPENQHFCRNCESGQLQR